MKKNSILTAIAVLLSTASFAISPITGSSIVCAGSTTTLSDSTSGGSWSSSNAAVATISPGGAVTGLSVGTATITYTTTAGFVILGFTVNPAPAAISGSSSICIGSSITLADATTGGSWISGNPSVATVSTTGVVTGVSAGILNIYYTMGSTVSGCVVYHTVTVNPAPAAISGASTVCVGSSTTLTDATTGGSWISGSTSIATVSSAGVVTAISAGVVNIYYTMGSTVSGCIAEHTVTVNAAAAISGPSAICLGSTITLTGTPSGGTWTASDTGIAMVSSSGVVTGLSAGVTNIYYLEGGCYTYHTVTVSTAAASISGPSAICVGSSITLTDSTSGGIWSGGGAGIATVSSGGVVTGLSAGVTNIYYSIGTSCATYHTVTVNPAPAAISGSSTVCVGSSITLTDATTGGSWISGSTSIATVSSAGVFTAVSAGVVNIYYTMGSTVSGCIAEHTVTVNHAPAAISGASTVCVGSSITLTDATTGGSWISGSTSIATVSSAGVVTAISAGVVNIYYTMGSTVSGCIAEHTVTVNAAAAISGPSAICLGSTITLTGTPSGGTWTASDTGIAMVSSSGVVTGLSAGVTNIYYLEGGCYTYHTVTVSTAAASISGPSAICVGSSITLTDSTSGGIWSGGGSGIATVSSGGVVTGLSAGVTNIYYSIGTSCATYHTVTVNPAPAAISGASTVCVGSSITLTDATTGGSWISGSTSIATVSSAGVFTAVSAGVVNIYYTMGSTVSGCIAEHTVTVNHAPAAISGSSTVCVGSSITLTDATTGGSWISGSTSVATVSSAGVVTAVSAGVVNIYYTMGSTVSGCIAEHTVTVNHAPAAITGASTVCVGSSITLTDATTGGSWISGSTSIATVSSAGVVTAVSAGVVNIYYAMGSTVSGCIAEHTITVNPAPAAITGASTVCVGSSITLTDATTGGSWISGSTSIATVSSAGVVTAVSAGVVNIYYAMGSTVSGCIAEHTITVNPAPAAITGASTVCVGSSITLTDATTGGSWISGSTSIATVSSAGVVTAVSAGVVNIYYAMGSTVSGCIAEHTITVNPAPAAITGASTVCVGSSITLTDATTGGSWISGSTSIATVSSAGVFTAVSAGVVNIYYAMGSTVSGCIAEHTVTVNHAPAAISGSSTVCVGSSITLTDATTGGSWISGSTSIATVSSAGVVTAVSAGVVNIYYTMGSTVSGCIAEHTVTVNHAPAAISGSSTVCVGSSITLTDATTGGSWISGSTSIATVSSAGVVTAVSAGVVNIYYAMGSTVSGCIAEHTVTVNHAPAAISGDASVCVGSSITLTDGTSGGSWISGSASIATVSTAGVVTGVSAGVLNIYYTMGSTTSGCVVYHTVTVNAAPSAISGDHTVCVGSLITLTDATTGGTWSVGSPSVATVTSVGVVTGVSAGVTNIYYHVGSCYVYHTVTVNASSPVTGPSSVCIGSSITLTDATSGGTWVGGSTPVATVNATGIVTGVSAGVTNIYYVMGGCVVSHTVSVNAAPAVISGGSTVHVGSTITLSDATTGGTWISSNPIIGTISSAGVVTGVSAGVINIYYTIGGCGVYHTVTVNASPHTGIIGGHILSGASKGTSGEVPVTGMLVHLEDAITNLVLSDTYTDAEGAYSFNGLADGSYIVYPELSGYTTTPSATIALGGSSESVTNVDFKQNTSNNTITPFIISSGVKPIFATGGISVYPNPAHSNLTIVWTEQAAGMATIVITDMVGREVYKSSMNINASSGQTQIDLAGLKDGIYLISINSGNIFYSNKLMIQR